MSSRSLPEGTRVAPSILSADYSRLGSQVREVLVAGARVIHVDVMDGRFVPPITVGPLVVGAISDLVKDEGGYLDVHLMVESPESHIEAFAAAGADGLTLHYEATPNVHRALSMVREAGLTAGLAINPGTPVDAVSELEQVADLVLCMTVNPGWAGQEFIGSSPAKVERLRELVGREIRIEVDGGISVQTAPLVTGAGATILVAGSAVFGAPDPVAAYKELLAASGAR